MSIGISTQEPLVERLSASSPPMSSLRENTKTTKRKRGADKDPSAKVLTGQRHTKKVKTVTRTGSLSGDTSINEAIADMDNQLLADYVAQQTRRFEDQLSSVELEDKYLPGKDMYGHHLYQTADISDQQRQLKIQHHLKR